MRRRLGGTPAALLVALVLALGSRSLGGTVFGPMLILTLFVPPGYLVMRALDGRSVTTALVRLVVRTLER